MKTQRRYFGLALAAMLSAVAPGASFAQAFPDKPIRFVVAFAAGGGTDILARLMAQKMSAELGQPILVENKPGANTAIATNFVAKSPPDGYTIFISTPAIVTNPMLITKLPYDSTKDFVAITQWASFSNILVAHPSLGVNTVQELVALAKAKPGQLNYGSTGNGSTPFLGMELLKGMTGINLVPIPYKGSAPAMIDLVGGVIPVMFDAVVTSLPFVKTGKVKALAVSGATRSSLMPDVPTIAESVPGYEAAVWIGMFAPTGTPKAVVDKLHSTSAKVLEMPEVKERLASLGYEPVSSTPEQFARFFDAEMRKWSKVIKDAGVKPE